MTANLLPAKIDVRGRSVQVSINRYVAILLEIAKKEEMMLSSRVQSPPDEQTGFGLVRSIRAVWVLAAPTGCKFEEFVLQYEANVALGS